jgi:hypothetical protein
MSYVPSFLTLFLFYCRLKRASKIHDFRMAERQCAKVISHWFADCDSTKSVVTKEFKTAIGTTQITLAQSSDIASKSITSHVANDLNIVNIHDDKSSNGVKEETLTKRFAHRNWTKPSCKATSSPIVCHPRPLNFSSRRLIHISGIKNRDPWNSVTWVIHQAGSAPRTLRERAVQLCAFNCFPYSLARRIL